MGADRLVQLVAHLPADESPTRAPLRTTIGLSVTELQDVRNQARTLSRATISTIVFATWIGDDETAVGILPSPIRHQQSDSYGRPSTLVTA